jgi:betaine-aldehyde dehydrogenase
VIGVVADGGPADLEAALAGAEAAAAAWADVPIQRRGEIASELGYRVRAHAERLAMIDVQDTGSPLKAMLADAQKGASALISTGALALELKGETIPIGPDRLNYTTLQPWGVVARIIAFNHPLLFACARLAPALVAGNAVLLKPSELAPLSTLALAELAADLVPPGVLSVLTGGPALGAAIARSPRIRRLSFTGSVATGLQVMAEAAESGVIKSVTLELGGKNPIIVFADADLDAAARAVVRGMNFTRVQGQSCGSTSRLLVHEAVHDELVARVVDLTSRIRLGAPGDPATEMGTMITPEAAERTIGFVHRAVAAGARLLIGGTAPEDAALRGGAFVLPTVLDAVTPDAEVACEEIFGPVLSVLTWRDVDAVVAMANGVRYGLTASIWTPDIQQAFTTAARIDAGYLWINDVETRYPIVPFGGWKDSGLGLENGLDELRSFTRTKSINVAIRPT